MKNNLFVGMYMCGMWGIPIILSKKMDLDLSVSIFLRPRFITSALQQWGFTVTVIIIFVNAMPFSSSSAIIP